LTVKTAVIIAFLLIAAGLSGFGLAEIIPNNTSSEENLNEFSEENVITEFFQGEKLAIPSSSTLINP